MMLATENLRITDAYRSMYETKSDNAEVKPTETTPVEESLKVPSLGEVFDILKANGYFEVAERQHGSHKVFKHRSKPDMIIVPFHSRKGENMNPILWKKIVKSHDIDVNKLNESSEEGLCD